MIKRHSPDIPTNAYMFESFLGRLGWLLTKFAKHEKLRSKIAQNQTTINIPEKYAKLNEGNTISGLQIFHCEKKGITSIENIKRGGEEKQTEYTWVFPRIADFQRAFSTEFCKYFRFCDSISTHFPLSVS